MTFLLLLAIFLSLTNHLLKTNKFELSVKAMTACYYHVTCDIQSESTLYSMPELQGTPCSKQAPCLKFNRQQPEFLDIQANNTV